MRTYRLSEFIQDDWRATPSLTVNLGIRYDLFAPYHEEHDRLLNFNTLTGTVLLPSDARPFAQNVLGFPNGNLPADWQYVPASQVYRSMNLSDISPRLGFAYAVNRKVSVRGGYGIFYDTPVGNNFMNGTLANTDYQVNATIATPLSLTQGLPTGGIATTLSSSSFGPYYSPIHRPDPYSAKYNLDAQWSPRNSVVFDIGYAGASSWHFPTLAPGNEPLTPGPGTLQTRQPYPNYGFFWDYLPIDSTNYNALTITATANNVHGLFLKSAYTFSKALGYDTGTDDEITTFYNPRYDYGPLVYNTPHRWVTSGVYQVPVPESFGRLSRELLRGWEGSGILTLQSGMPFTPTDAGAVLNVGGLGGAGQRPNRIPNVSLRPSHRSIYEWFNTAAFQNPAPYTFGNAGKDIIAGPGIAELDFALQKRFALPWEGHSVTFRMETTNLFNHPNWGTPGADIGGSGFGVIQTTQNNMRVAQAVLRYEF